VVVVSAVVLSFALVARGPALDCYDQQGAAIERFDPAINFSGGNG
jgi:hypothetical protein